MDAPLTTSRCLSPMKLTLSMMPESGALPAVDHADGFGADHRNRGWHVRIAANRLPSARQHEMTVFHRRFDDIRGANEFGHEAISRREIDLARRADLGNRPLLHDDDTIAELHGLGLIVRHVDRGDAQRAQQAIQFAAQPVAQRGIERGQRLIEQQDARPDRNRARQRDALALTAGELVDAAVLKPGDIGQRHQFGDARRPLLRRACPRIFRP